MAKSDHPAVQGKVEVIAVYDREIRGVTVRVKLPSVLRLLRHVRMKRAFADVPFSRANVYARDQNTCQHCGGRFAPSQLTFDHVVPVARGGRKDWNGWIQRPVSPNCLSGSVTGGRAVGAVHAVQCTRGPQPSRCCQLDPEHSAFRGRITGPTQECPCRRSTLRLFRAEADRTWAAATAAA